MPRVILRFYFISLNGKLCFASMCSGKGGKMKNNFHKSYQENVKIRLLSTEYVVSREKEKAAQRCTPFILTW